MTDPWLSDEFLYRCEVGHCSTLVSEGQWLYSDKEEPVCTAPSQEKDRIICGRKLVQKLGRA